MQNIPSLTFLFAVALSLSACGGDDDNNTANDSDNNPPQTSLVGDHVVEMVNQAIDLDTPLVCDSSAVVPSQLRVAQGIATFGSQQIDLANAVSLSVSVSNSVLDDFGVTTVRYVTIDPTSGESEDFKLRITNDAQLEKVEKTMGSTIISCTPAAALTLASSVFALEPQLRIKTLYAIPQETREQDMLCAVGPDSSLPPATAYHAQLDQLDVTATPVSDPSVKTLRFNLKPVGTFSDFRVFADRGASFNSVSSLGQLAMLSRISPTGELVELSRTTRAVGFEQERCDQD